MNKYKAVYVEWVDSAVTDPGWMQENEAIEWASDDSNNTIRQIGFIIKKTKKTILLASRVSNENIGGVFKIPVSCITTLTSLPV